MNFKRRQKHTKGILPDSLALGMAAVSVAVATSAAPAEPPAPDNAGKFGRVVVVDDHFEFKGLPGVPQRFYGVNLCNTANLPSSPEAADRFVANLARVGYNALRIHHHERDLISEQGDWPPGHDDTVPSPAQMEKLDWLVAACIAHGVYLTTDLYVSRSYATYWRAIGIDRDGRIDNGPSFKILCAFWEPAYSNLCAWTRNFLCHVNPSTGRSLAEEPALVALALVNEGNLGNWGAKALREFPCIQEAWGKWLDEKLAPSPQSSQRSDRSTWRTSREDRFDWALIPRDIPDNLYAADGSTPENRHAAAFAIFLAERETLLFERLKTFVREECGCRAPLSSLSAWYYPVQYQLPRTHFDYVDEHFYVDHPKWLGRDWHLPSYCPNVNPVAGRDAGARDIEWRRLMDKPFCLTEWNFSGPGRFRGVGGIVTGALGALQDWDGLWRFAWSHGRAGIENPGARLDYFNVHGDPLGLAAERAALCLFLRRDLPTLEAASPLVLDKATLLDPRNGAPRLPGRGQSLAQGWTRRVGTKVISHAEFAESAEPDAAGKSHAEFAEGAEPDAAGKSHAEFAEGVEPDAAGKSHAEFAESAEEKSPLVGSMSSVPTGVSIDPITGTFLLDTPCTAGGFAESGAHEAGALTFVLLASGKSAASPPVSGASPLSQLSPEKALSPKGALNQPVAATVWASSLDGEPLPTSSRILVTHLTDVQNSGIRYGDAARTILLDWGGLPHLAENGSAEIELAVGTLGDRANLANSANLVNGVNDANGANDANDANGANGANGANDVNGANFTIYRLSSSGHRLAEIPASFDPATGRLRFIARTDYDPVVATLFYEIVRDPATPSP